MEEQANRMAPNRSKISDGSIGDEAHSKRKTDHNPSGGFVHAIDLTHDPANGFDVHQLARQISQSGDTRIKYIISQGKIWNPTKGDMPGHWRPYSGENPHNHHAHFSVRSNARNDTRPWFGNAPDQMTPKQWAELRRLLARKAFNDLERAVDIGSRSNSDEIRAVQISMNLIADRGLVEDGDWGSKTAGAVRDFQKLFKLPETSVFDKSTREMARLLLDKIASGD
jgi:peptidoglycan hydrolase-like protein with peptidoglycan-binding domain